MLNNIWKKPIWIKDAVKSLHHSPSATNILEFAPNFIKFSMFSLLKRIGITMMESAEADAAPSDGDGQAHTGRGIRRQPTTTHLPFIGGGTSAKKMMTQMFDLLDNDGLHYVNADVLWITDFLIPDPPQQLLSRFREYKETGTRFYGIRIVRDDDKEPNAWKEYSI